MLRLSHVTKTFNKGTVTEKRALTGVDLTLNDGDFVTVIGGNGAGKSTLLNMIAGVYPLDSGVIELDGKDISRLSEAQRAKYLGRVFQDPMRGTAADMQIVENLALARRRGKRRGLAWGVTKDEKAEYPELLARLGLGLETRLDAKVGLLSGGQRQALTLLMATLTEPKLLLLDEHPRPQDRCQGARAHRGDHLRAQAHRPHGHAQHDRRHPPGQPPHHDGGRPRHLRRLRR